MKQALVLTVAHTTTEPKTRAVKTTAATIRGRLSYPEVYA